MIENEGLQETNIWRSFLDGDNKSLETIYRTYFDELYRYGNRWLNDAALTEDVIQDLFVKLIRNRNNLSDTASVKFYLFKAFRTTALDKLRSNGKIISKDTPGPDDFPLHVTPEHLFIEKEDYEAIKRRLADALNKLTPRQREAIFLKYIEGFSYEEISEMMSLTTKAAYKLMARGIEGLKEQMGTLVLLLSMAVMLSKFFKILRSCWLA